MNSDFRNGAINQKGQTQYINTSYKSTMTIDGWFTDYGSVNVFANSVYFDNTGSSEYGFKQPLNFQNGTYTFYLDCAINGSARVFARNLLNEEVINESISGTVKKPFTFTNSLKFITIIASPGTKISYNFMKLEKGLFFTGMPILDKGIELARCKRKFSYEVQTINVMYDYANNEYGFYITWGEMDKTPTISNVVVQSYDNGGNFRTATEVTEQGEKGTRAQYYRCKFSQPLKVNGAQLFITFYADSYEY